MSISKTNTAFHPTPSLMASKPTLQIPNDYSAIRTIFTLTILLDPFIQFSSHSRNIWRTFKKHLNSAQCLSSVGLQQFIVQMKHFIEFIVPLGNAGLQCSILASITQRFYEILTENVERDFSVLFSFVAMEIIRNRSRATNHHIMIVQFQIGMQFSTLQMLYASAFCTVRIPTRYAPHTIGTYIALLL